MLLHGCFNIGISGPQTQYLKMFLKFSRGPELQPLRASRTLSFPQICRFCVSSFNANEEERGGSRRRVGVWPWAAWGHGTMRSAYSGCFTMTKHTTINPFLFHTTHIRSCAQTYTEAHTHARTHNASQYKGSDTLAQVRGYVLTVTAPPSTHAQVRTHTHAHTPQRNSPR